MGLTGREFYGAGENYDLCLMFDGGSVRMMLNGRDFDKVSCSADPYDFDNKVVIIEDLSCGIGTLKQLSFEDIYNRDSKLSGELITPEGTTETIVFHSGSEENLYIDPEHLP